MSALGVHRTLHPYEGASPSPLGSRPTHSRQMSSLSMTTFTTSQSHYPSEPLLRNADHQEAHAQQPPDASVEERRYWEKVSARRMRRSRLLKGALLSIIGSWAIYSTVRYFIAYVVYLGSTRQSVALSLGISSLLSLLVAGALALSLLVSHHTTHLRPLSRSLGKFLRHVSQFLASFFLFVPAAVNLALVFSWRNTGSDLSLRGRCHWDLDVVWVGVGGQCTLHAPAWGAWLAAAISRFVLTVAVLILYHLASKSYRSSRWLHYCAENGQRRDTVEITRVAHGDTPSRPSPVLRPFIQKSGGFSSVLQRSSSSGQMAVIPEFNEARNQIPLHYDHEYAGLDSVDSSTLSEDDSLPRSVDSSSSPKSLRHATSSRDSQAGDGSSRRATLVSNVEEGELEGFADRFRVLVDRVSRELEEARNLENEPAPRTPPLHHVLDTHMPYMSIDEFGREVFTEEPIAVLGGVIRRMPTIDSVGSRELASLRSTTLVSASGGGVGSPSIAPSSSASSRPPTRATMISFNDAASASLASASAASSRSNSIHRPRMPSEIGELVRDALRARGQPRSMPSHPVPGSASVRPGSGGSGSGIEPASAPPRSRSNSQGASEVLAPVTEHGEHGLEPEDPRRAWAPRRLCDTPEQLLAAGASELGELVTPRHGTERSRSWGSSSPSLSATSTTYFTAGTGSVSGSNTGTSGGGGGGAPR